MPPILSLGQALSDEAGKLRQFIDLLKREQELLKRSETDALLSLIDTKNDLASRLGALSLQRESELSRLGLPAGRAGMEAWLAHGGNATQRPAWEDLLALAAEARSLNELNGRLIGLHMQHNQQAFNALMSASNRAMTYGRDGQQHTGLGGRILGKA